jgi:hypothetical protein
MDTFIPRTSCLVRLETEKKHDEPKDKQNGTRYKNTRGMLHLIYQVVSSSGTATAYTGPLNANSDNDAYTSSIEDFFPLFFVDFFCGLFRVL